jgi:hypothetical protein
MMACTDGMYRAADLNNQTKTWNSLSIKSANNLREELDRVARLLELLSLQAPASGPRSPDLQSSVPPWGTDQGQYERCKHVLRALHDAQSLWDTQSMTSKELNAARVHKSVVLFAPRLRDSAPILDEVRMYILRMFDCEYSETCILSPKFIRGLLLSFI